MGTVTDLTTRAASIDELRRRALEGDTRAVAEISRRRAEEEYRLRQRRRENRQQVALAIVEGRGPGRGTKGASKVDVAVSTGSKRLPSGHRVSKGVRVA